MYNVHVLKVYIHVHVHACCVCQQRTWLAMPIHVHVHIQYASKKLSRLPFKRSRGDRAFCVKGPFNLNGRNVRTTAGIDLHRTRDWSTHNVVFN